MNFSDIQLSDKALWAQIQAAWKAGNYATALTLMGNSQLAKKVLAAQALNDLTDKIVETEQLNDPDYANDRIEVSRQDPSGMTSGEVYFQVTNDPYTFADVDARQLTFADVDGLGLTWADADRGGW